MPMSAYRWVKKGVFQHFAVDKQQRMIDQQHFLSQSACWPNRLSTLLKIDEARKPDSLDHDCWARRPGVETEETTSKGYRKDSYFVTSLSSSRVGSKKENESASTGKSNHAENIWAVWGRQQQQQQLQQEATGAQRFCQASTQIGRFTRLAGRSAR
jgi:hypothetical protein